MTQTRTATCSHCQRLVALLVEEPDSVDPSQASGQPRQTCPFCGCPLHEIPQHAHRSLRQASCRQCGAELSLWEAAKPEQICASEACLQHQIADQQQARRKTQQEFRERMEARAKEFWEEQTDLPSDLPISLAIVPVNQRSITPLPEDRKEILLNHLRTVMAEEVAQSELPDHELSTPFSVPEPIEPKPSPQQVHLLGLTCAVCRGYCCRQGAEHAFQDVPSMRRIRESFPSESSAELLALYAAHIPQQSYENSCVFHTELGCNLPREMRSDMCNTWHCPGQHEWLAELPREGRLLGYIVATPRYDPQAIRAAGVGEALATDDNLGLQFDQDVDSHATDDISD